jgi:hypothetical protein
VPLDWRDKKNSIKFDSASKNINNPPRICVLEKKYRKIDKREEIKLQQCLQDIKVILFESGETYIYSVLKIVCDLGKFFETLSAEFTCRLLVWASSIITTKLHHLNVLTTGCYYISRRLRTTVKSHGIQAKESSARRSLSGCKSLQCRQSKTR